MWVWRRTSISTIRSITIRSITIWSVSTVWSVSWTISSISSVCTIGAICTIGTIGTIKTVWSVTGILSTISDLWNGKSNNSFSSVLGLINSFYSDCIISKSGAITNSNSISIEANSSWNTINIISDITRSSFTVKIIGGLSWLKSSWSDSNVQRTSESEC